MLNKLASNYIMWLVFCYQSLLAVYNYIKNDVDKAVFKSFSMCTRKVKNVYEEGNNQSPNVYEECKLCVRGRFKFKHKPLISKTFPTYRYLL